jgi:hypothetical protein
MAAPTTGACVKKTLANPEPSTHGPSRRWRSPELAAGNWGSPAATVASEPQGATYAPDCRAGQFPQDRGTEGPQAQVGSTYRASWCAQAAEWPLWQPSTRQRILGLPPVALRVVWCRSPPPSPRVDDGPEALRCARPRSRTRRRQGHGNLSFVKCDLRHTARAVAAAFKGRISCGCQ